MKAGRNDPCPCGSGKKYKHCCLPAQSTAQTGDYLWHRLRRFNDGLPLRLLKFADELFGPAALTEAWDAFTLGQGPPFDPGSPHLQVFMPWFYYDWMPDPEPTQVDARAPRGETVVGAFLRRKGGNLDAIERRYLEACLGAPFSFHEVVRSEPGRGFVLRDVLTGEEHDVTERSGSRHAQAGDILFAKVVPIERLTVLDGCSPVLIPPVNKAPILGLRRRMKSSKHAPGQTLLRAYQDELLALYYELAESLLNPALPELRNTDGDVFCFHRIIYDVDSAQAAFDTLKVLATGHDEEDLLASAERDQSGALRKVEFQWLKRGNKLHKHWDNTVVGHITIDGTTLAVEVNSQKRAEKFHRLAKKLLGDCARYQTTVIESPEALLACPEDDGAAADKRRREQEELESRPEVQALIAEQLRASYDNWVHQKLPVLGGKTPLQAIKNPEGREMVEALLTQLERDARKQFAFPTDDVFVRLRVRLGMRAGG